jgi:hypothetical protein
MFKPHALRFSLPILAIAVFFVSVGISGFALWRVFTKDPSVTAWGPLAILLAFYLVLAYRHLTSHTDLKLCIFLIAIINVAALLGFWTGVLWPSFAAMFLVPISFRQSNYYASGNHNQELTK